jgi:plasmid stabilization system protein ParE
MKRYRISPAARDDLKQISRYIAVERQSPEGAKRLRELFLDAFRLIGQQPFIGQACAEFGPNMRIWPVRSYVVLYQPQEDGVDIVQVAHGARDLPAIVRRPSDKPQS